MKTLQLQEVCFISGGIEQDSWSAKISQTYQNYGPSKTTLEYVAATIAVVGIGYLVGKTINSMFTDSSDEE